MKKTLPLLFVILISACQKNSDPIPVRNETLKLASTTTSYLRNGQYELDSKSVYAYTVSGNIQTQSYYTYNAATSAFELNSVSSFEYVNNKVSRITMIKSGETQTTSKTFKYTEGRLSNIFIDETGVDTEVLVIYQPDNSVQAIYNSSNGRYFTYIFSTVNQNVTVEEIYGENGELKSKVTHTYDDKKNPYSLEGYTDAFFLNYSANNKTATTSDYMGGSYPQIVPDTYEYIYNDLGFPTQQITRFKSYNTGTDNSVRKVEFEYK